MSVRTTQTSLIYAMLRLLRKRKFSALKIEDVCEKAHVSRRTFYRYYQDKFALLRDVYVECFFSKIEIDEDDDFWDIFARICEQIYADKDFFRHALEVKGQNGFWDETSNILTPFYMREAPSYDFTDEMKAFFVETEMNRLFRLIENWISSEKDYPAQDFYNYVRINYYIYGKWTSQLAAKEERSTFSREIFRDFEGYLEKAQESSC